MSSFFHVELHLMDRNNSCGQVDSKGTYSGGPMSPGRQISA